MPSSYRRTPSGSSRQGSASRRPVPRRPVSREPLQPRSVRMESGVPYESMRLGDLRQDRHSRMQSNYRSYVRRVVLALGAFAALVILYAALYFGGAFPVTKVTVNGCEHLTNDEVARIAAVPADSTLMRVDTAGITGRLLANAWVEDASVSRIPFDTLQLNIHERAIGAVVQVAAAEGAALEDWAISSDGIWLMMLPDRNSEQGMGVNGKVYEDADAALHITQVPYGVTPAVGEHCADASVNNALDIISGLSSELADQVTSVEASGVDTATLTLENGVQIAFGDADDIRDKERVALQLMREHEGLIAYINVRTPSRPTWRSL